MKTIILSLAVASFAIAFATPMQAAPKNGGSIAKSQGGPSYKTSNGKPGGSLSKGIGANKIANYHLQHGTKFEHGYFYKGKHHEHWGEIRFDPRYGCNCYWDSCLSIWYYWCERDVCYYPVSYCPYRCYVCPVVVLEVVRPVVVVRPIVVQPVCECQPVVACNCGASFALEGVLRTGHVPVYHGPRHSGFRR